MSSDSQSPAPKPAKAPAILERGDLVPIMRRLWAGWVRPHRGTLIVISLAIGTIAAMSAMYPYLIKTIFDAYDTQNKRLVQWTPIFVILVTTIKGLAMYTQTTLTNRVVTRVEADLQTALYRHLIDSDIAQLSRETPAALTQRFTTDFAFIREALTRISTVFLRDVTTGAAVLAVMFWIDWQVTLGALLVVPIVVPPLNKIGKKLRRTALSTQEQTGQMASMVAESLSAARVAKAYGLEGYLKSRAANAFDTVRALKMKAASQRARMDPLLEICGGLAVAGVLIFIGWRIVRGQSTIGDFTGYVTAVLLAAQSLRSFGNLNAIVQEALAALSRLFAVLDEPPGVSEAPDAVPLAVTGGEIAFDHVSFAYGADGEALSDIDIVLPAGKMIAFVGRSGAGKSSLMSLVPRLFDPTAGRVLIDGTDIRAVTLESLRRNIAIVSQDIVLFDDSVRANIGFGRPGASEAEIVAAARAAAAHDFVSALPQGYDTPVGDRGGRLSGGERQRIALARAILRDAPILLLDEPTSALDAQSEDLVQRALADLMKGRTTLVVAHRLATIRAADLIVVLEKGRIVETGTHEELIEKGGAYAAFHRLQFGTDLTPA